MIYRFLFPRYCNTTILSLLLLALRLLFGILFMMHGFDKLYNFSLLVDNYPNFMGLVVDFRYCLRCLQSWFVLQRLYWAFFFDLLLCLCSLLWLLLFFGCITALLPRVSWRLFML